MLEQDVNTPIATGHARLSNRANASWSAKARAIAVAVRIEEKIRRTRSCNSSLSSDKSATMRFKRSVSPSSSRNRSISDVIKAGILLPVEVSSQSASLIPCRMMNAFCASVNFDGFVAAMKVEHEQAMMLEGWRVYCRPLKSDAFDPGGSSRSTRDLET
jgi:hypothetical protein